ncbi:hypothetical protein FZI91_11485 [Mycobacterium sp. CBMA271]|uniref:hypothetical protein n=1 Tax=unclassified Mycobacteroides TaxID=2618759 RepID=UPI0012DD860A|nr:MULTISPECIES: hypothetical protein [unclassified Mycobacteroides]MUM16179.1 hypothetical protein [Mycobacteroides sp. CBMA 326]MUM22318.1 hypothetical protein [Mycobacteroides sp. CBMA 271]
MASNRAGPPLSWLAGLRDFQEAYAIPVEDTSTQAPAAALSSLREAANNAPPEYADYLAEAVECYERQLYRAAILMVWAATIEHMYGVVASHRGGVGKIQAANFARYGQHGKYREVKKKNDLLYLSEDQFIQLSEDAGMINRNARRTLAESLTLRNLCGHPTQYRPGREQAVIFVESLVNNILSGSWLQWR